MADILHDPNSRIPISRVTLNLDNLPTKPGDEKRINTSELHPHDKIVGRTGEHGSKKLISVSGSFPAASDERMSLYVQESAVKDGFTKGLEGSTKGDILHRLNLLNRVSTSFAEANKGQLADELYLKTVGLMLGRYTSGTDRASIFEQLKRWGDLPSGAAAPDWTTIEPIYPDKENKK